MPNKLNLEGKRFGRLLVLSENGKDKHGNILWECLCDCGSRTNVRSNALVKSKGGSKSCGCLSREKARDTCMSRRKFNTYSLDGDYGIGYTTKGEEFYFDLEDYAKIKDFCWFLQEGYVVSSTLRTSTNKSLFLHRLVMDLDSLSEDSILVDHINKNRVDARKSNLRYADKKSNAHNCNVSKNNTSGVTGVSFNKRYKKWESYVVVEDKTIHLGKSTDFCEAVRFRLEGELKYCGEFAPQKHLFKEYGVG
jgi:hypothetical protein